MASRGKVLVNLALENFEVKKKPPDDKIIVDPEENGAEFATKPSEETKHSVVASKSPNDNATTNSEVLPNSSQLTDKKSTINLIDNSDSKGVVSTPNDAISHPSTSSVIMEIETDSTENVYAATRTDPMKIKLRKISNSKDNYMNDSEDEDVFAEESSEYAPSESEKSFTFSENESLALSSDARTKKSLSVIDSGCLNNLVDPTSPKKGKKRTRNPEEWKKSKSKLLKNSGKSYISRTGKTVEERVMRSACSDRCKLSCSTKFDNNLRTEMFEKYWKLASLQRQRDFLGSCIQPLEMKYRRISSTNPRRQNCAFYLLNDGNRIRVCKTFIINTFGITERTIRTVIQSKDTSTGMIAEDKRGRHGNQTKIDEEILNSVRAHINSIPRIESHYLRSNTSREFIDGGLSIAEMHRNYSQKRNSASKATANYDTYARIFNVEFNIGFFAPRKDQCDLCESYKNANGTEKEKLEGDYKLHLEEKKLSREEKARDKEKLDEQGSNIVLATYDLQAVLPVPTGQTSAFFYKSRLNCYNLTISEIQSDNTFCYFWHEGLGNRGANDIGSCVLMFLEELATTRPGADVVFYTDNCGGQQKNRFVLRRNVFICCRKI